MLNDTAHGSAHHGCRCVMDNIKRSVLAAGLTIAATFPVRTPATDPALRAAIRAADLVIINGEGSLHHGRPAGQCLIDAAAFARFAGRPVVLINALYQDNPGSWDAVISGLDAIWARDRQSAAELSRAAGRPIACSGELALCTDPPTPAPHQVRRGVIVGDSFYGWRSWQLYRASGRLRRHKPARIVPIQRYPSGRPGAHRNSFPRHLRALFWREIYRRSRRVDTRVDSLPTYLAALADAGLSVTGRYHAVCLSLLAGTPLVALDSNSWKIRALLEDAGLDRRRLIAPAQLTPAWLLDQDWSWSARERAGIERLLGDTRANCRQMFHDIAALAGVGQGSTCSAS
ncbi:MAG: polysaccharide pyruvyl transferase family protein [Wenzhouxiangellaceae bacterium]